MNLGAWRGDQGTDGPLLVRQSVWEQIMGRAILAFSGSAIALLPRPFALISNFFSGLWREMTRDVLRPYRPELHYMRGPGPAWRAKHGIRSQD